MRVRLCRVLQQYTKKINVPNVAELGRAPHDRDRIVIVDVRPDDLMRHILAGLSLAGAVLTVLMMVYVWNFRNTRLYFWLYKEQQTTHYTFRKEQKKKKNQPLLLFNLQ